LNIHRKPIPNSELSKKESHLLKDKNILLVPVKYNMVMHHHSTEGRFSFGGGLYV
jgi:hypothetical protein